MSEKKARNKPKVRQPQKRNQTSFKKGNKAAEIWTEQAAIELFEKAMKIAKEGETTYTGIARELDVYTTSLHYLPEKFPDLLPVKKEILKILADNLFKAGCQGDYVPAMAIFGLKNNHKWTDKQEIEHTTIKKRDISEMSTDELIKRAEALKKIDEA